MNEITLSCIGYFVEVQDSQVIFTESRPVAFVQPARFSFERPTSLNNTGGIWYLTSLECRTKGIVVSHIIEALKYCEDNFGKCFEPLKGELKPHSA